MKAIDFEYYGYLDEDDGVIVPLEQEYEKRRMSAGATIAGAWFLFSPLQVQQCILPKAGFIAAEGLQGIANDLTSRWQVRQSGSCWTWNSS